MILGLALFSFGSGVIVGIFATLACEITRREVDAP